MRDLQKVIIKKDTSIIDAIEVINRNGMRIALVVDEYNRLIGVITDGDIRRGLLRRISTSEAVSTIMNEKPICGSETESASSILSKMQKLKINHIPIVDELGKVIKLEILEDLIAPKTKDNWVVIMAGGLGTRLHPMTKECPKPLLKIGTKPILEIILENLIAAGFSKFYFAVNYKAEMIKHYFDDGSKWNVELNYIEEKIPLGTAGALTLLPSLPNSPMLVMNGDIMTKINFHQLLDFHSTHNAPVTMCVREYSHRVPYGVVKTEHHRIIELEEKPEHNIFVNAGIYLVEPSAIELMPSNSFYNMTDLCEQLIKTKNSSPVAFPIHEYWLDIGRLEDFERAHRDHAEFFDA